MEKQVEGVLPPEGNVTVVVSISPISKPLVFNDTPNKTLKEIRESFNQLGEKYTKFQVNGKWVDEDYKTQPSDHVNLIQSPQGLEVATIAWIAVAVSVASAVAGYLLFEPPEGPTDAEQQDRIRGSRNEARKYDPVPVILGERRVVPAYAAEPYTEFRGEDEYLSMLLVAGQGPLELSDVKIGDTPIDQYEDVQWDYIDHFTQRSYENIRNIWNVGVTQDNVDAEIQYNNFTIRNTVAGSTQTTIEVTWRRGLRSNSGHSSDGIGVHYLHNNIWYVVIPDQTPRKGHTSQAVVRAEGKFWLVGDRQRADKGYRYTYNSSVDITSYHVGSYNDPATGRYQHLFNATALEADGLKAATLSEWASTDNQFSRSFTFSPVNPTTFERITESVSVRLSKSIPEDDGQGARQRTATWVNIKSQRPYSGDDLERSLGVTPSGTFYPVVIAIKIKATNQLNGILDNLNCNVKSVVPQSWTEDWSTFNNIPFNTPLKTTENPAELYRWVLQGTAGKIRIDNSRIDLAALDIWRTRCVNEGWKTSEYVNYAATLKETLSNVAFTGRAEFSIWSGLYSVVEKKERVLPEQVFTPKNTMDLVSKRVFKPKSDGIKYKFQNKEVQDQVDEGTYFDPAKFDNNDETQPKAGAEITGSFQTVEFWGVTDPDLARRHARFLFFEEALRREVFEFKTDIEGLAVRRGSVAKLSHDVLDIGVGQGFIKEDVNGSATFFLDEERGAVVGETQFFQVRQVNSGVSVVSFSATYKGGGEWLADSLQTLSKGDLAVYGQQGKESIDILVTGVSNEDDYVVTITATNAANQIYNEDLVTLPAYQTGLTPRMDFIAPAAPIIDVGSSGYAYETNTLEVFVKANTDFSVSKGAAKFYTLQFRALPEYPDETIPVEDRDIDADDTTVWLSAGTIGVNQNSFSIPVEKGFGRRFKVRAKAIGDNLASPWSLEKEITISSDPADDVIDFVVEESVDTPKTPDGMYSTLTVKVTPPSDENYLFSIAEYRLPNQEQFLEIGRIGWKHSDEIETVVLANGTQYEFRVRSVSHLGVINQFGVSRFLTTTNTQSPEYTDENPFDALPVPNVRGLELFEQGNDTEFGGKDAKFVWRKSTVGDWVDLGYEGLRGAGASRLDQYFRDYQVEVWADNRPVRTEFVVDNLYVYTFEKNAEDFKREIGEVGAYREFELRVVERGRNNQVSERTASLSVSNTAPQALQGLTILPGFNVIEISYTRPVDLDFAGVDIWVSTVSGFDPDTTEPTITTSDNNVVASGLDQNTTYYVRLRPFDDFGKTGTNTTSEFVVKTKSGVDLTGLSGWAYQIDPVSRTFIQNNIQGGAIDLGDPVVGGQLSTTKLENLSVEASKLADSSVTATKIANLAVGTAAIDTAAITNAKIANLAVGTANLQDASIKSAKIGNLEVTNAKIVDLTAAKLTTGTLNATETITSEGLIRAVDDANTPSVQTGIGPTTFGTATTYLMWAYNGQDIVFGVDELGNVEMTGALTASSFSNTELTIDAQGNLTSTGDFSFGDVPSGEYIRYVGGVVEIGPNTTIGSNENRTVTVGVGGDYSNLNDALEALSRVVPSYKSGGFSAEISLLSGFVLEEQIRVDGIDLSWITITSVDAVVSVGGSFINEVFTDSGFSSYTPLIAATSGGKTPRIGFSFTFNNLTNGGDIVGLLSHGEGSVIECVEIGVSYCGNSGVFATKGGSILCDGDVTSNNNGSSGVFVSLNSSINCRDLTANSNGQFGVLVGSNSKVSVIGQVETNSNTQTGCNLLGTGEMLISGGLTSRLNGLSPISVSGQSKCHANNMSLTDNGGSISISQGSEVRSRNGITASNNSGGIFVIGSTLTAGSLISCSPNSLSLSDGAYVVRLASTTDGGENVTPNSIDPSGRGILIEF